MSYDRAYIKQHFPDYDYRKPTQPWRLDYFQPENRIICNFQMQAFSFWWAEHVCKEEGLVGLALEISGVPFCISTSSERGRAAIFSKPQSVHLILEPNSLCLLIASVALPTMDCPDQLNGKPCGDFHIIQTMKNWGKILKPGGYLVAAIADAGHATTMGVDLVRDVAGFTHAWSARRFHDRILTQLGDTFNQEEFDTLKNNFAFDVVLRKK